MGRGQFPILFVYFCSAAAVVVVVVVLVRRSPQGRCQAHKAHREKVVFLFTCLASCLLAFLPPATICFALRNEYTVMVTAMVAMTTTAHHLARCSLTADASSRYSESSIYKPLPNPVQSSPVQSIQSVHQQPQIIHLHPSLTMKTTSLLVSALSLAVLAGSALAHPGEHEHHEDIERLWRLSKRSLAGCPSTPAGRRLKERALARRSALAAELRQKRGLPASTLPFSLRNPLIASQQRTKVASVSRARFDLQPRIVGDV